MRLAGSTPPASPVLWFLIVFHRMGRYAILGWYLNYKRKGVHHVRISKSQQVA